MKFSGNSPQKGGLVHQKGGRSKGKSGSHQMYDTKRPYQVFLWYRLGKYRKNTNRYHTKIPNRDTTLQITIDFLASFDRQIAIAYLAIKERKIA